MPIVAAEPDTRTWTEIISIYSQEAGSDNESYILNLVRFTGPLIGNVEALTSAPTLSVTHQVSTTEVREQGLSQRSDQGPG